MRRIQRRPSNGNTRAPSTQDNAEGFSEVLGPGSADESPGISSPATRLPGVRDFHVSADRIRHFAGLDLGELVNLPAEPEDLVALSIRMEDSFTGLVGSALQLISEDYEDISSETLEAISRELALGFIERYGTLAFCSSSLLRVLWSAQRLRSAKGPRFMREVGQRLDVFVAAQKGRSPQMSVDVAFAFNKPQFLAELEQISHELGSSESNDSKADQLLRLVITGNRKMLRRNLTRLEQFLRCTESNPYLHATNASAAERLAQYGARRLTSENGQSITPDWFFYIWVGWMVNKSPSTVRRLIQTAETKFRAQISSYEKTDKR